jgi:hypothetical protein
MKKIVGVQMIVSALNPILLLVPRYTNSSRELLQTLSGLPEDYQSLYQKNVAFFACLAYFLALSRMNRHGLTIMV